MMTTSNPVARPELREGGRGALALVPERGIRRHQQPGERCPRADLVDERVVGRPANRFVEVLDDGHGHALRRESLEALVRIEQERRRGPGQDLVRMVVERDDRRPGVPDARLHPKVLEQVPMATMQAIEHADDGEDRAVRGPQALDPGDDIHQAST